MNGTLKKWRGCLVGALLFGLCSYGGLCLLVWRMQNQLIFFPDRKVSLNPSALGLKYKDLFLKTTDGVVLHGWMVPPPTQDAHADWVLHCHGNGGNISNRIAVIKMLHDLGLGVVVFDYRGYGLSHGQPDREEDLIADGQAFVDEIRATIEARRLILFGESLGGGVACALALRQECAGLILQSTFTSLTERAQEAYPFLPVTLLSRYKFDNRDAVARLKCPKLILHSPQDEVTGVHHGRALYQAAAEPRLWAELQGGHNETDKASLENPIRQFLQTLAPR